MSAELTTLVLLTALFHAMWNALVKARDDRLVELATLNGTAGLIAFAALPFVGLPEPRAWPYLATTMVLHSGYYFFLLKSYAAGDLSHVYAVARGSGPVFVLATSSWVLHEPVSRAQVIGVLLIADERREPGPLEARRQMASRTHTLRTRHRADDRWLHPDRRCWRPRISAVP